MYEPDNSFRTADYLGASPNNTYYQRYIGYGDDDYSYFYAYAGETISINTYSDYYYTNDVDTTVTLYRGYYGSQVAYNDDGGAGLDSSLNYYVSRSGYYYFDVEGYSYSSTGYYNVSVDVGY